MNTSSIIVLLLLAGSVPPEAMTQSERPIVFSRVCNIEPGQDAAAAALAREMVALVNERYPGAEMTARTGRWMTGFQSLAAPVNQIRFTEQHPDLETRDIFTAILLGDDDFETLQRKVAEVIDFGSCADTQFRARP
ncbi:MAG: hypothetical protein CL477_08650 [Acidobacteria bacterium]|jgi:hypothetical protein|nr:hypothetical protein [Acidobacteriota bacterium]MDP7338597.1 hypothetical protein [Vicinamibacterales bacterium]MDP7480320.1 hypothetical protein [Vicinamibacterales bacterium]HJN45713.1 hypothetical protein [Vicinamibacterales bacterium]|tara:strand:- start:321 stop:728 length:408 start_codon:yes stop_codon:yes gene_type:complete